MTSRSAIIIEPVHPGEVLAEEFLKPMGLSASALARRIGVPGNRISEIAAGRRAVTGDTALRLPTGAWRDLLTGERVVSTADGARAADVLARLPVALLVRD